MPALQQDVWGKVETAVLFYRSAQSRGAVEYSSQ